MESYEVKRAKRNLIYKNYSKFITEQLIFLYEKKIENDEIILKLYEEYLEKLEAKNKKKK